MDKAMFGDTGQGRGRGDRVGGPQQGRGGSLGQGGGGPGPHVPLSPQYYDDTYPSAKEQKAFEKNIFNKTHRTDSACFGDGDVRVPWAGTATPPWGQRGRGEGSHGGDTRLSPQVRSRCWRVSPSSTRAASTSTSTSSAAPTRTRWLGTPWGGSGGDTIPRGGTPRGGRGGHTAGVVAWVHGVGTLGTWRDGRTWRGVPRGTRAGDTQKGPGGGRGHRRGHRAWGGGGCHLGVPPSGSATT